MDRQHHRIVHGLRVTGDVAIGGYHVAHHAEPVDLEIVTVGSLDPPSGDDEPILSFDYSNGQTVRAARSESGAVRVEFSDVARFRVSAGCDRIEMAVGERGDAEYATVLLEGWVMAMTLMLAGHSVLHASAVEVEGEAVLLLAHSGMGKSTIASMLVRDGAALLADDVLRVDELGGRSLAHPGVPVMRLRPKAAALAEAVPTAAVRRTSDDRIAATVELSRADPVPIRAVLLPLPFREATELEMHWLDPVAASVELTQYPRVFEWQIEEPIRRQFEAMATLASNVPVGFMVVPWGPPWPDRLLDDVLEHLSARDD